METPRCSILAHALRYGQGGAVARLGRIRPCGTIEERWRKGEQINVQMSSA